ncbi:uncharacterized protein [Arachis hypogaea]|uniref:Essential protein Yae1 N-terminal domain-containing protein n=1 Tax=Arachis hypogaea TaxID=3818 RepID=A0A445E338_ARAHY|nr:uncharacterized protein LOC112789164 isoform X1 [Arachis hypogaea]QHO55601.1 Yae1 domain-containing protein [Arachis hypogaea]RYR69775.1 hypothetical protein Ahy_A03g016317 isoform C [Arachis hypogaea]
MEPEPPSQMEGKFAEELYAESLELSKSELKSTSAHDQENKLHECDDDDLWGDSDDKLDKSSDLDREWQRRHDEFHTIGYREGLIAGKEASSQEGFNIGFKQSVLAGYSWGAVRGVTSAFAHLPDELKEKLVEKLEKRNELHGIHESVHSVSTADALRFFHEDIKAKEALEQSKDVKVSPWQTSHVSHLRNYHQQLESLIHDTPTMDIHLPEPK